MIIKEIVQVLDSTIYRNYSDKNVYIKNLETGLLYSDVNSTIDYEYEETDVPVEIPENNDQVNIDNLIQQAIDDYTLSLIEKGLL